MGNAGLAYRQLPTHKDGNCLFHAMNEQLSRLGRVSHSSTKSCSDPVNAELTQPSWKGTNLCEYINLGTWTSWTGLISVNTSWTGLIIVNISIVENGTSICVE